MIEILKSQDIARSNGKPLKTVVFVGNGAIQVGWTPIRSVLDRWINNHAKTAPAVKLLLCQNSEAFHQLAILSYKFKVARANQLLKWHKKMETPKQTESSGLPNLVRGFLDIRSEISS